MKKNENKFSLFEGRACILANASIDSHCKQRRCMETDIANRNAEVEMRHEQLSSPRVAIKEENALTK